MGLGSTQANRRRQIKRAGNSLLPARVTETTEVGWENGWRPPGPISVSSVALGPHWVFVPKTFGRGDLAGNTSERTGIGESICLFEFIRVRVASVGHQDRQHHQEYPGCHFNMMGAGGRELRQDSIGAR